MFPFPLVNLMFPFQLGKTWPHRHRLLFLPVNLMFPFLLVKTWSHHHRLLFHHPFKSWYASFL